MPEPVIIIANCLLITRRRRNLLTRFLFQGRFFKYLLIWSGLNGLNKTMCLPWMSHSGIVFLTVYTMFFLWKGMWKRLIKYPFALLRSTDVNWYIGQEDVLFTNNELLEQKQQVEWIWKRTEFCFFIFLDFRTLLWSMVCKGLCYAKSLLLCVI